MDEEQKIDDLMDLLERIALALEKLADAAKV
jgi:hypothetical protein